MTDESASLMERILERMRQKHAAGSGRQEDMLSVWTNTDFLDIGQRWAVDKALQRLVNAGEIRRPARGLYYLTLPANSLTGIERYPAVHSFADAIVRRDHLLTVPTPKQAANDLGLEDMGKSDHDVISTGMPRRIVIPNPAKPGESMSIFFRKMTPRQSHWVGRPAMTFVQAVEWYRVQFQNSDYKIAADEIERKIVAKILSGERKHAEAVISDLSDNMALLKFWMQPVFRRIVAEVQARLETDATLDDEPDEGMKP